MRDALLCLLLLTLALFALNASGEKQVHRILRKSGMQKKNIWRQMRKNTAALKKLALAEYETQQVQQKFGSAMDALKENVEVYERGLCLHEHGDDTNEDKYE